MTAGGAVGAACGTAGGAGGAARGVAVVATRGRNLGGTTGAGRGATGGSKTGGISGAGRRGARVEVPAMIRWVPMVEIVGPDSQRKSRLVRLGKTASGKLFSSKTICHETIRRFVESKTAIAFVIDRVAQEDTPGGTWRELMWRGGSRVRVAHTTKEAQMLVGGRRTKQGKMRKHSLNRRCQKTV
jgi:hypothetical protein